MIKLNEKCPDFEISNQKGETFSQKHLIGKISVLFFYPKNFTPGCTKEACSFRDNYSEFKELGCLDSKAKQHENDVRPFRCEKPGPGILPVCRRQSPEKDVIPCWPGNIKNISIPKISQI